ncbi:MAG: hypothetical protein EB078_03020 [Proteobacteria bacterium]|nr:hypothetical protein [Pseudomonadota bacterium]NDC23562.1 hypothetical protein [Pseudomonadota bacterium]NDD03855.1 hypothetical protein [Pseudomonadota bacterium]NDG27085.1 hypothetical protein [Pseudomonadota bacterium]
MDFGVKTTSIRNLVAGTAISGALAITVFTGSSQNSKKTLAEKINAATQSANMKVAQVRSKSSSSKDFNQNDGNAFGSTTTYHSYTWDYCQNWVGQDLCEKWLDPYISEHGFGGEQSVLEGKVASIYSQMKESYKGEGGKYAIWNVKTKGGAPILDEQGRLNRKALTQFEINDEAKAALDAVGVEAAKDAIAGTFNENEPKETMPNMETLRALAQNLTWTYRNHLVAKLGELRRMKEGIELPGGENMTGCDSIMNSQKQGEQDDGDKHYNQAELAEDTQDVELEQRMQLCRQMMAKSVRDVNPTVKNGQISSGDPNSEQIDEWRARVNIAILDNLGIEANEIPKPSDAVLTQEELSSDTIAYDDDGKEKRVLITPKEQLEHYNAALEKAAKKQAELAKRTLGHIPDEGNLTRSNQITPGSISAMKLNGLTKEMKKSLKGEDVAGLKTAQPEMTPEELIQTANQ